MEEKAIDPVDPGKKKKHEPKYAETVSLEKLFGYADKIDVLLMILGSVGAAANGAARPLSFLVFGKVIEKFIEYSRNNYKLDLLKANGTANATQYNMTNPINLEEEMKAFAVWYVLLGAILFICAFMQAGCWSMAPLRQVRRIRQKFFHSILKQDIGWFDVNEGGGLLSRLSDDLIKIQSGIGDKVGLIISNIFQFLAGFSIGFIYSWKLSLVILAVVPGLAAVAALFGKVLSKMSSKEQSAYSEAAAVATEALSSIRTVVALGAQYEEIERYDSKLAIAEKAGFKKAGALGGSMGLINIAMMSAFALGFWYGAQLVEAGEISGGEMLTVFFSILTGGSELGHIAPSYQAVTTAQGAAHFVFQVCEKEPTINCMSDEGSCVESVSGDIKLKNVDFSYPSRDEVQVLKSFNLDIKSGTTVALVGGSGCGKSTIVKLVQRFYDPSSGDVTLDGISLKDLNLRWMRSNIGVVSQEPVLFEMSISDNIQLGESGHVSQKKIEAAARDANAHEFIMSLPEKYDTYVGEGGAQLSGGQKQRIAIARALVRDPKILLLDEATSALDTESEGIVQAALDNASEGRTTIIIAHRLSSIRNADVIVTVKDGEVVETGTHKELIEKRGFYYQLVILQAMVEEVVEVIEDEESLDEEEKVLATKRKLLRTMSTLSAVSHEDEEIIEKVLRRMSILSAGSATSDKHEHIVETLVSQLSIKRKQSMLRKKRAAKEKGKEEEEEEKLEPASYLRILKYGAPEWPYMLSGVFFAAILGAHPLIFAFILGKFMDEFTRNNLKEQSKKFPLYFVGFGVVIGFSHVAAALLFGKAGEVLTRRLRKLTFKALLRQDISYFDHPKNSTGQVGARLASDAANVQAATGAQLNTMTQVGVIALTALVIGFTASWKLTLVILAFVPILFIAGGAQFKIFGNFAAEESKRLFAATALASESIMNIRTVASLGKEEYFVDKFNSLVKGPFKKSARNSVFFGITYGTSKSVMMLANAAGFALGGKLVQDGELKFDEMITVYMAVMFGAVTAGRVSALAPDFLQAKLCAARIFQILDRLPSIDAFSTEGSRLDVEKVHGNINFSDINFHYPTRPGVQVLQDFTLDIKAGQKVAFVGSSGCGKSTTIGLLERFYDPISGAITLDSHNTNEFNISWLRSILGLVSQEPVLFSRSIRDNITFGLQEKPSEEEIQTAAKNSNIHSFISTLPQGYDTMVGEKGTLISGGQKQRIAIARALVRNPKIMLLDEATSALDSESERVVQDALDAAMVGRTSIIIAHRLSTIQNADVIVVIQDGKIAEMGTHQELLANLGAYYELNRNQVTA